PVAELRRALAARRVSAVEVTEAYLGRIEQADGTLHAFVTTTADAALAAARDAETALARRQAGPLTGIPVAAKDLIAARGGARSERPPPHRAAPAAAEGRHRGRAPARGGCRGARHDPPPRARVRSDRGQPGPGHAGEPMGCRAGTGRVEQRVRGGGERA